MARLIDLPTIIECPPAIGGLFLFQVTIMTDIVLLLTANALELGQC
ncbi:hypothetical protein H9L14_01880 [Sphingomonas sediminicola]|uniref:Uncharacterized protein n=1 Tax=Sphingomonas sediminicola TaxID=386874 RepID=A0ABX6T9J9_9SPHN|nr:hypothetical protein [Sphingomonas sediminicola]QNP46049.1 hypothetical protein H9L14_01880 [Sphingomonas sediminicola]